MALADVILKCISGRLLSERHVVDCVLRVERLKQAQVAETIESGVSGHCSECCYGRVAPWHEVVDLTVGVAIDDFGQGVGEVGERIDAPELRCFDERRDDGPMFAAAI